MEASNAHLDPRFHSFGPFKDTATVKINVLDVDEPPVFSKPSYTMDVYEDTPQGTIIGAVTAQDLDAGNSPVRYVDKAHIIRRFASLSQQETSSSHQYCGLGLGHFLYFNGNQWPVEEIYSIFIYPYF